MVVPFPALSGLPVPAAAVIVPPAPDGAEGTAFAQFVMPAHIPSAPVTSWPSAPVPHPPAVKLAGDACISPSGMVAPRIVADGLSEDTDPPARGDGGPNAPARKEEDTEPPWAVTALPVPLGLPEIVSDMAENTESAPDAPMPKTVAADGSKAAAAPSTPPDPPPAAPVAPDTPSPAPHVAEALVMPLPASGPIRTAAPGTGPDAAPSLPAEPVPVPQAAPPQTGALSLPPLPPLPPMPPVTPAERAAPVVDGPPLPPDPVAVGHAVSTVALTADTTGPSPLALADLPAALVARAGGGAAADILLNPAELGWMRFEMSGDGADLHLTLCAEQPATLDMLRRHAAELLAEFRQAGFMQVRIGFGQWAQGGRSGQAPPQGVVVPPATTVALTAAPLALLRPVWQKGLNLRL